MSGYDQLRRTKPDKLVAEGLLLRQQLALALREVATGFLADYENSEGHWIVSVGTLAELLNEVAARLLTGNGSAQTIPAEAKPRADAMFLDIYNKYKDNSPLLQDTLCT